MCSPARPRGSRRGCGRTSFRRAHDFRRHPPYARAVPCRRRRRARGANRRGSRARVRGRAGAARPRAQRRFHRRAIARRAAAVRTPWRGPPFPCLPIEGILILYVRGDEVVGEVSGADAVEGAVEVGSSQPPRAHARCDGLTHGERTAEPLGQCSKSPHPGTLTASVRGRASCPQAPPCRALRSRAEPCRILSSRRERRRSGHRRAALFATGAEVSGGSCDGRG